MATFLKESGEWLKREQERCQQEINQLLQIRFMAEFQKAISQFDRESLVTAVAQREMDPYTAVNQLLQKISSERIGEK